MSVAEGQWKPLFVPIGWVRERGGAAGTLQWGLALNTAGMSRPWGQIHLSFTVSFHGASVPSAQHGPATWEIPLLLTNITLFSLESESIESRSCKLAAGSYISTCRQVPFGLHNVCNFLTMSLTYLLTCLFIVVLLITWDTVWHFWILQLHYIVR